MVSDLPDQYRLCIDKEVYISASVTTVYESLLEQMGPGSDTKDGQPMPMILEAWPGGRWYRDLGPGAGHFWGNVQVIKPPTLLEITGPLFMSYAVISHVQYRLSEQNGSTRLTIAHRMIGDIAPEHRANFHHGWDHVIRRVNDRATR